MNKTAYRSPPIAALATPQKEDNNSNKMKNKKYNNSMIVVGREEKEEKLDDYCSHSQVFKKTRSVSRSRLYTNQDNNNNVTEAASVERDYISQTYKQQSQGKPIPPRVSVLNRYRTATKQSHVPPTTNVIGALALADNNNVINLPADDDDDSKLDIGITYTINEDTEKLETNGSTSAANEQCEIQCLKAVEKNGKSSCLPKSHLDSSVSIAKKTSTAYGQKILKVKPRLSAEEAFRLRLNMTKQLSIDFEKQSKISINNSRRRV
jgi:hypothetical protein